MAKAGAHYGMSLLWTIVASCLATFVLINAYGRYTLVTGETALQAMRKHLHPGIAIFFIVALTAGVSGSVMGVMGVMGIVADISFEWSKMLVAGGIPSKYFAGFFIALVLWIFWQGETQLRLVGYKKARCLSTVELSAGLAPTTPCEFDWLAQIFQATLAFQSRRAISWQ